MLKLLREIKKTNEKKLLNSFRKELKQFKESMKKLAKSKFKSSEKTKRKFIVIQT